MKKYYVVEIECSSCQSVKEFSDIYKAREYMTIKFYSYQIKERGKNYSKAEDLLNDILEWIRSGDIDVGERFYYDIGLAYGIEIIEN